MTSPKIKICERCNKNEVTNGTSLCNKCYDDHNEIFGINKKQRSRKKKHNNRNGYSLSAMITGLGIVIYQFMMISDIMSSSPEPETAIGLGVIALFIAPSFVALLVAVLLNVIGYFLSNKVLTLVSAIIYIVALILSPLYGWIGIPSMIMQFIAYGTMGRE